jgi:transposase
VPRYPSDLSDDQWSVLEPLARAVMNELVIAAGRPMSHDLRAMVDAVAYVTRNGIEWRAMPADFPPWDSVYAFCQRWNARGLPQHLAVRLRGRLRAHQGRQEDPTGAIIDSQIIKCADTVAKASSGYHGGKKITGRGRHLITGTEGWPLALAVTAASTSGKAGARLAALLTTLTVMWADTGYNGRPLRDWMRTTAGITLEIVARTSPHTFQVLKRRWVIERTFGWLMRYRRLARDYERTTTHHEAMIWWATILIMTKRLTRYETQQPPPARWGHERPPPHPPNGFTNRLLVGDAVSSSGGRQAASGCLAACSWALIRSRSRVRSAAVNFQLNGRTVWL